MIDYRPAIRISVVALFVLTIIAIEPALASDPSDVFEDAIREVFGEVASIATFVLFAYGMIQVIKLGVSDDSSGAVKKLGLSWGIAVVVAGWDTFMDFISESADEVGMAMPVDVTQATVETAVTTASTIFPIII